MRAAVISELGPPENIRIETVPDPEPGVGQVVVETAAAGANFADLLQIAGEYQVRPKLPFIPGKELAGTVVALGASVTDFQVGDKVTAQVEHGAFAEKVAVPMRQCAAVPDGVEPEVAATFIGAHQTAHFALNERAAMRQGERILVLGASSAVGLATMQIARMNNAAVIAGITRPEKKQLVREYGAEFVVNLARDDLRDSLREDIYDITDSEGVDIVVDMLGGDAFDAALRATAWRGRLIVIGFAAGRIPTVKTNYLLLKNISVTGLQWANYRDRTPEWVQGISLTLYDWMSKGHLKPLPVHRFALDDAAAAMRAIADRTADGRVVLMPN